MRNSGALPCVAISISKSSTKAAQYFYHKHLAGMGTENIKIIKIHGSHIGARLKAGASVQNLALVCTYHAMQLALDVQQATLRNDESKIEEALSRVDAWNDRGVQIFHDKDVAACVQTLGDAGLLEGERWRELLSTLQCDAPTHATNVAGLEALM